MTREEASKMAKAALECMEREVSGCDEMCNCRKCYECNLNYEKGNMGEQKEWLRLAIKALEQEPCDDCVRRQEVLDVLRDKWNKFSDANDAMQESIDTIEALKPVTPQPKRGRWIEHFDESGKWYECDQCHTDWGGSVNYCPNCGTKMEG